MASSNSAGDLFATLLPTLISAPNLRDIQLGQFEQIAEIAVANGTATWWNQLTSVHLRGLDEQSEQLLSSMTRLRRASLEYPEPSEINPDVLRAVEGSQDSLQELCVFQFTGLEGDEGEVDCGLLDPKDRVWPRLHTLEVEQMHFLHLSNAMPNLRRLLVHDVLDQPEDNVAPPSERWPFVDFVYSTGTAIAHHGSAYFPPPSRTLELDLGASHCHQWYRPVQSSSIHILRGISTRPRLVNLALKWHILEGCALSLILPSLFSMHPALRYLALQLVNTTHPDLELEENVASAQVSILYTL